MKRRRSARRNPRGVDQGAQSSRGALSLRNLKKTLAPLGIVIRLRDGEYRVNFKGGHEATAYYTNDAQDALHTARAMAKQGNLQKQGNLHKNPPIYTSRTRKIPTGSGASHMIGISVFEVWYRHAADGKDYHHPFSSDDVMLLGMPDGSLKLESATGKKLWKNFDV